MRRKYFARDLGDGLIALGLVVSSSSLSIVLEVEEVMVDVSCVGASLGGDLVPGGVLLIGGGGGRDSVG